MSNLSVTIPNFQQQTPQQKPPVEMMREAAQTLSQQTGEIVEGSVFTSNPGSSNLFRHTFYLRARSLNDYTYPLFYVWHNADLYPCHILEAGQPQSSAQVCQTDVELRDRLVSVFASAATAQLVQALIAQADQ